MFILTRKDNPGFSKEFETKEKAQEYLADTLGIAIAEVKKSAHKMFANINKTYFGYLSNNTESTSHEVQRVLAEVKEKEVKEDTPITFEKQQVDLLRNKVKLLEKHTSMEDHVINMFSERLEKFKPTNLLKDNFSHRPGATEEELVLVLTDWHAGENVFKDQVLGLNEYNREIFIQRVNNVYDSFTGICAKLSGYTFKKLHVFALGDMLCLTGDSDILMADGFVKDLKDIKIGDELLGRHTTDTVKDVIVTTGSKQINQLKITGIWHKLKMTDSHVVPIIPNTSIQRSEGFNHQKKKKYISVDNIELVQAKDIQKGDYFLRRGIRKFDSHILDISKITGLSLVEKDGIWIEDVRGNKPPICTNYLPITDDLLYIIGLYIAEGNPMMCRDKINSVAAQFTLNINERELAKNLITKINNVFGEEFTRISEQEDVLGNSRTVVVYNKIIATLLTNITGRGAVNKHISPEIYSFTGSLLPLVGGWLDGDGHSTKTHQVSGKTISKTLSYQISNLCLCEGINANITMEKGVTEKKTTSEKFRSDSYKVSFAGKYANAMKKYTFRFCNNSYKNGYEEGIWVGPYYAAMVRTIQKYSTEEAVYDLKMTKDPYFQVNGVISHNCGNIHQELLENSEPIVDQVILGGEVLAEVVQKLSRRFQNVEVTCVIGNHGRTSKQPYFKNKYNNFDYLAYKYAEAKCATVSNIKFDIPKAAMAIKQILGYNFLLRHGDMKVASFAGIPFYGISRAENALYQNLSNGLGITPHYTVMGHFHQYADIGKAGGRLLMCGSIKGVDEYSFNSGMGLSGPSQLMFSVHKKRGITLKLEIDAV